MDQIKSGKFIAEQRKRAGLTQLQLGEMLGITDRAVSKWENGKSMPDVSIMLELCSILDISVNELLSGERIEDNDYRQMAEENFIKLRKQEEEGNRKLLIAERVIELSSTAAFLTMNFAAEYGVSDILWKRILAVIGAVIFIIGLYFALRLQRDAGYFECPNCHARYIPSMIDIIKAPHIGLTRRLKCPYCGQKGWSKKVLMK